MQGGFSKSTPWLMRPSQSAASTAARLFYYELVSQPLEVFEKEKNMSVRIYYWLDPLNDDLFAASGCLLRARTESNSHLHPLVGFYYRK